MEKKTRIAQSEIIENILMEIPLQTKIGVAMQLEYMGILSDLGLRECKSWGDDENELLSKLMELAKKQTERIMEILNETPRASAEFKLEDWLKNEKRYKCLLCGRDTFTQKSPHNCKNGFRKTGLFWQEIKESD